MPAMSWPWLKKISGLEDCVERLSVVRLSVWKHCGWCVVYLPIGGVGGRGDDFYKNFSFLGDSGLD